MTSISPSNSTGNSRNPIFVSDEAKERPTKSRKSHSASSELTDLTSDASGSSQSNGSSKEDAEGNTRMDDGDEENVESPYPTDEEAFKETYTGKAPSREERVKYRDLLNTKLEQMFVKAKIELSPFGRIPWTKLGEALVSRNCYITGFPEAFAPKVANDQLTGGTAPSTWSVNRSKPILALIESGKLRIEPRPAGRKVLFELTRPDGTTYDSTIGYSTHWLQTHMPNEFPSRKRPRSEMTTPGKPFRARTRVQDTDDSDWSDDSQYDLAGRDNSWHSHHHKRQRLSDSRSPSHGKDLRRSSGGLYQAPISNRPQRGEKPKKVLEGIKQGEKWEEGGTVKKVGRGWIVVEDSTDSEEAPSKNTTPPASNKLVEVAPPEQVASKKRKRSEPPESNPQSTKRMHADIPSTVASEVASEVTHEKRLRLVMAQIARMIRDAGYNGSKKIPWCSLPLFLCQRKLYVTGFPYTCLPKVINDEVKNASSPLHWKPAQCLAMEEALTRNLVKILARSTGRMVLFEATGIDGKAYDSTCGFSAAWIEKNLKKYYPTTVSAPVKDKQSMATKPVQSKAPSRPSLKLVIPNNGQSVVDRAVPLIKVAKPPPSRPSEDKVKAKPGPSKLSGPPVQIPRSTLPAPTILLEPPTPPGGRQSNAPTEKLQLAESPMLESPSRSAPIPDRPPSPPGSLNPPPSPPPMEPVALPALSTEAKIEILGTKKAPRLPSFTFKIPPAKPHSKDAASRQRNAKSRQSLESPSTSNDSMSVDESRIENDGSGIDLGAMFDSPSRENPLGGLPSHLQPRVANRSGSAESFRHFSQAKDQRYQAFPPSRPLLPPGSEIVAAAPSSGTLDTKWAIEKRIRPSLVKLFDAAGLSSPGVPLPWVMLPAMLCQQRLYISGFPRQCLPKVVRDRVDGASGPRGWSYNTLLAMLNALTANEVTIKRRPKGRNVLFHLLPTDAQREQGNNEGVDSTLTFSKTWLDEHMVDYPEDLPDDGMNLEPSDAPVILRESAHTPLRRDSVWERFGKFTIEESESEDENRVPDPPWKTALEEFIRPAGSMKAGISRSPSTYRHESDVDGISSDGDTEQEDEERPPLNISHLLPSHLPHPFQGKGRILLGRDDRFEWIPTDPYATDCPPTRMVWNPSKSKWKLLPEMRDFVAFYKGASWLELPNRVEGNVLGKGVAEYNTTRKVWECSFVGRGVFGDLRWSPDVASWEWFPQDVDGRRKWLGYPGREYGSLSPDEL